MCRYSDTTLEKTEWELSEKTRLRKIMLTKFEPSLAIELLSNPLFEEKLTFLLTVKNKDGGNLPKFIDEQDPL